MGLKLFSRRKTRPKRNGNGALGPYVPPASEKAAAEYKPAPFENPDEDPLRRMAQQGQYAAILRDEAQWNDHPDGSTVIDRAKEALEMALPIMMNLRPSGVMS